MKCQALNIVNFACTRSQICCQRCAVPNRSVKDAEDSVIVCSVAGIFAVIVADMTVSTSMMRATKVSVRTITGILSVRARSLSVAMSATKHTYEEAQIDIVDVPYPCTKNLFLLCTHLEL